VCDFEGHTLYAHGGGYTGARTMMAFSPDLGVGIGVFSNSDNMTGWLTSRTMIQFLQFVIDHEDAGPLDADPSGAISPTDRAVARHAPGQSG
jgi:hypothetical protein